MAIKIAIRHRLLLKRRMMPIVVSWETAGLLEEESHRENLAKMRTLPSRLQSAIHNLKSTIHRGHSSVGRAPALQAGSQGFESPCLQSSLASQTRARTVAPKPLA